MKTKWENLGEQIRIWTNTAAERAGVITRAAASKAEELSKIGRLKMDIYQLQRERNRLFAELGKMAFESLEGAKKGSLANQPGVENLRKQINAIDRDIKNKEMELEQASDMAETVQEKPPEEKKAETTQAKAETKAAKPATAGTRKKAAPKKKPGPAPGTTKKTATSTKK